MSLIFVALLAARTVAAPSRPPRCDLTIVEDFSGSLDVRSFAEARSTLSTELPTLVESLNVQHLEVRSFDVDGWQSRRIVERELPELQVVFEDEDTDSEGDVFGNVKDAAAEERNRKHIAQTAQRESDYRRKLATKLNGVVPLAAPPERYQAASTDISGVFHYMATVERSHPAYFILITDLSDSHHVKELPKLPAPKANVKVIVVFVPSTPTEIKNTLGKSMTGSDQFDLRSQQLKAAAPWAIIVPHTQEHYADIVRQTGSRRDTR
jgi:hypothetical protein